MECSYSHAFKGWVEENYRDEAHEISEVIDAECVFRLGRFVNDLRIALEWLDAHFIFTPEQLKSIRERTGNAEPMGPHGSARPNQQTIEDLRTHSNPQVHFCYMAHASE